jgi:hypothetical protein
MREVEEIRRTATTVGFLGSAGIFAANELSRLTLRSRKYLSLILIWFFLSIAIFRLGYVSVPMMLLAPTLIARLSYNDNVNDRIDNLWRIHRNREDQGMGGTYTSTHIDNGSQHY